MELFVFSFGLIGLAFGAMGLGVALGRSPLRRGCGEGAARACEACTRPCPRRARRAAAASPGGGGEAP